MGGDVTIRSVQDIGTTILCQVTFMLDDNLPVTDTAISVPVLPQVPLDILDVEDNRINQLIIRKLLTKLGHVVYHFDLVIC